MKRKQSAAGPARPADRTADRSAASQIRAVVVLASPYAQQAATRFGPVAQSARQRGGRAAQDAIRAVGPRLNGAYLRLNPVLVAASGRINDQLAPRLGGAWHLASASPVVVEATKRGRAALAAARGELSLPVVTPKKQGSWPKRLAVAAGAAGAGGAAAVIAKKWLALKEAEQQETTSTTSEAGRVPSPSPSPPKTPTATSDTAQASVADEAPDVTSPPVHTSDEPEKDPAGGAG